MVKNRVVMITLALIAAVVVADDSEQKNVIQVPAFELPVVSPLLGEESRAGLMKSAQKAATAVKDGPVCPFGLRGTDADTVIALRNCLDEKVFPERFQEFRERFDVKITSEKIAGVPVEIFEPNGISEENKNRVLINLHGGAFVLGAKYGGRFESMPVAAMGKFKVISIDYRKGPEHKFPAASEDVAAVYRELLKTYQAKNIGMYGCSSGGKLTAQSLAWFQKEGLPTPGAVGMFCAAAVSFPEGDGWYFNLSRGASPAPSYATHSPVRHYVGDADWNDPMLEPGRHDDILANFPPSLLLTSTRDQFLSAVAYTHSRLVKFGVEADLHVWEGLGHGGFLNPDIPEFEDAHNIIISFFEEHLGL